MFSTTYIIGLILIKTLSTINGQSTTASYFKADPYMNDYKYPRSKYYYFFTPRTQARELLQSEETVLEDRGYDSYEGYSAQWPSKVIHQQPIHVHHNVPQHQDKKKEDSYLIPLILLALLPFLLGAVLILPLLFTFFTNILQLLALIQQTIQNMNQTNNTGRRRRSDLDIHPMLTTTIESLVEQFTKAHQKYNISN